LKTIADLLVRVYNKKDEMATGVNQPDGVLIYSKGEVCAAPVTMAGDEEGDRLHLKRETIGVQMARYKERMEFRQSNESKLYLELDQGDEDASKQPEYIRTGNLMHLLLSRIGNRKDAPEAVASLQRQGLIENKSVEKRLLSLLDACWDNEQMCSWFDGSWQLFTECSILVKEKGRVFKRRPDRVMVKNGEAVVVDFKYAKHRMDHVHQVNDYVSFLKKMGYQKVSGYLWYGYEKRVVECDPTA
jgi:ATP-dependent helicase/nuclease subunit A